ncbi:MAG: glycerol-3-phosphate dehydrogenase/oxidase [Acidobacteriota bacterium]
MPHSPQRAETLDELGRGETWDLVVIGGGATGLGVALDAVARGYRTLLLEAVDYGKGTSSRSTKLIHGGVRYLARGELRLVWEALHERGRLVRNAPRSVRPLSFLVPCETWGKRLYYGAGLRLYDYLSGSLRIGRTKWRTAVELERLAPALKREKLLGAYQYWDAQFDDARFAVLLLRNIERRGGRCVNHCRVVGLLSRRGKTGGVLVRDTLEGREIEVPARVVINAAGPFADEIRRMEDPAAPARVLLSRGAHLVLPAAGFPEDVGVLVPRTRDGRVLFALPWWGRTLVGTTDVPQAELDWEPAVSEEEFEYLDAHLRRYLPGLEARAALSRFAGLRPLVAAGDAGGARGGTAAVSRDFAVEVSRKGLVSVLGGKWTTYRLMAEAAVARAAEAGGLPCRPAGTRNLRLEPESLSGTLGWDMDPAWDPAEVRDLLAAEPGLLAPLHERLPYSWLALAAGVRWEQAQTVEDLLARRTRSLLLDAAAAVEAAPAVARWLARRLERAEDWAEEELHRFLQVARVYLGVERTEPGRGGESVD